jgi:hypothetical protein
MVEGGYLGTKFPSPTKPQVLLQWSQKSSFWFYEFNHFLLDIFSETDCHFIVQRICFSLAILPQIICKHFLISPCTLTTFRPNSSWYKHYIKMRWGVQTTTVIIINFLQSFITLSVEIPSWVLCSEMLYLVRFVDKMCYWPSYPLQTLISLVLQSTRAIPWLLAYREA